MGWYRLKRPSGEVRYAASLAGEDTAVWTTVAISRCPEPWEAVGDDGKITADLALKAQMEADAALNNLSKPDLFALAILTARDKLIDDMSAAGVITVAEAAALQESAP